MKLLKPTSAYEIAERTISSIEKERSGIQQGLCTRYTKLNNAFRKYMRFGNVNLFAGLSGSGKSTFLNIITTDFLGFRNENNVNYNIDFVPIVFSFCLEMSPVDELVRSLSQELDLTYNYIFSSELENSTYRKLSDEDFNVIIKRISTRTRDNILYFEQGGTVDDIYNTCITYINYYLEINSNYRFIINIDHTLLIDKSKDEISNLDTMSNLGKKSINLAKHSNSYVMVNLLGQLNNNIETSLRKTNATLHYPQKSDIYAQAQLYNACDNVGIIHRPEYIGIKNYGIRKLETAKLIHYLHIKSRFGKLGSIWFKEDFAKSNLICFEP